MIIKLYKRLIIKHNNNKKENKLFGDKGYILYKKKIKEQLKNNYNVELISKSRKNIKNTLSEEYKKPLRKRNIIETVIGEIKRLTNIITTRIKNI